MKGKEKKRKLIKKKKKAKDQNVTLRGWSAIYRLENDLMGVVCYL